LFNSIFLKHFYWQWFYLFSCIH